MNSQERIAEMRNAFPIQHDFAIPWSWLSRVLSEVPTVAELKVILFIYLNTVGRNVSVGAISTNEFMHGITDGNDNKVCDGIGLARQHVIRGLNSAAEHGHILVYKNMVGGKQRKWYFINTPENARLVEALENQSLTVETLMEGQLQQIKLQRLASGR